MIISGEIKRIEDWYYKAGPKDKDTQWKDDYSAKEFARLWFDKNEKLQVPQVLNEYIGKCYGKYEILFAIPEHETRLDDFRGGQRNHDMFLYCRKENGEVFIVCIEAKVCEPLDKTLQEKLDEISEKSRIPSRIFKMLLTLKMKNAEFDDLRYQLFTGMCGTIKEAEKYKTTECLFLVLQIMPETIVPGRKEKESIEANYSDIKNFLNRNNATLVFEDNTSLLYKMITASEEVESSFGYLKIAQNK